MNRKVNEAASDMFRANLSRFGQGIKNVLGAGNVTTDSKDKGVETLFLRFKEKFDKITPSTPTITPTVTQSPAGQTPEPTKTPAVTPTPTSSAPCRRGCCYVELCSGADCAEACSCNFQAGFYLSIPCETDPCTLANALGIYTDDTCTNPARAGSYSDGFGCWDWDGSSTLTFNSNC